MPTVKHPDAMLLGERTVPAHRPQDNLFSGALHFEYVPSFEVQFLPQRLGNDNAAGLIDDQTQFHSGTYELTHQAIPT